MNALELTNPGSQTNADGATSISLTLSGSGPSGDTLTYGATGLPAGLYLNTTTGNISGTITPQDDLLSPYTVNVDVSDSSGNIASQSFEWTVTPKVTLTDPGNQSSVEGDSVSLSLSTTYSGSGTLAYSAAGLPAGLSINGSTGAITGTPTTAGTYTTALDVGDGRGPFFCSEIGASIEPKVPRQNGCTGPFLTSRSRHIRLRRSKWSSRSNPSCVGVSDKCGIDAQFIGALAGWSEDHTSTPRQN